MNDPLKETAPGHHSRTSIIQRRRLRRIRGWRAYSAALFILIGLAVFLAELGRHYARGIPIEGVPIFVGAVIAFVGFYMLDPRSSLSGGTFLVNSVVTIISTIRTGRRATDQTTVVTKVEDPDEKG